MTLRKKFENSALQNKMCKRCKNIYPRNENYFYQKKHQSYVGEVTYDQYCIACENKRIAEYRKNNPEKYKESLLKYIQSENGYLKKMYSSNIRRSKHGNTFKNADEFIECWEKQKVKTGWSCPYYPWITMTMIKGKGKQTVTNLSCDRILSDFPYGPDNIMFISWEANNKKGNVDPYLASKYLNFVNEHERAKRLTDIKSGLDIYGEERRVWDDIKTILRIADDAKAKADHMEKHFEKIYKPLVEGNFIKYDSEEERIEHRKAWGIDEEETEH